MLGGNTFGRAYFGEGVPSTSSAASITLAASSGVASSTLALSAQTQIPLAASSGVASATLTLTGAVQVSLSASSGAGSATLTLTATTTIALGAASGVASATISVTVSAAVPLASSSGATSATLTLSAQTVIVLSASSGTGSATLFLSFLGRPGAIREYPPLRLAALLITPSGLRYRWAEDEPAAENVLGSPALSDTMPGGFEQGDATLRRKPGIDYRDLERLSTLIFHGAGGEVAWEGRLERAPRVSGDQMAISPSAVGWQAGLADDNSAAMIYVDQDQSRWGGMPAARKVQLQAMSPARVVFDGAEAPNADGLASILTSIGGQFSSGPVYVGEAWYSSRPGVRIGAIAYTITPQDADIDAQFHWAAFASLDETASSVDTSGDLNIFGGGNASPQAGMVVATGANKEYAVLQYTYDGESTSRVGPFGAYWRPAVFGDHGLGTHVGPEGGGVLGSDVLAHAIANWAPALRFTTGSNGTIAPTDFLIPHLVFADPTNAAEIVKGVDRFELRDWAVWEDRTFYYSERGARGRKWRARVGPAQLQETGPSVDRLWNGVIVRYTDVGGTTKLVGPPGAATDFTAPELADSDPANPANVLGIRRWSLLDMGEISTAAGATRVGARFLEESKQLDGSGQAAFVGIAEDDRGVRRPAWQVRAGDYVAFGDAADTSYRRIVKKSYDHASRTATVDLDAPPAGLDSLLERLGVVLIPLGL